MLVCMKLFMLFILLIVLFLAGCSTGYDESIYEKVHFDKNDDCGNILDYQCGTRTICNAQEDYGSCPINYECTTDNLCIASDELSCDALTCSSDEYCSHGVCLLEVPGKTYFVALWGNDSNPGTFEQPFYHWQRAVEVSEAGDLTYIRGGVWYATEYIKPSSTIGMLIDPTGYTADTKGGTKEKPIKFYNYPGERPILDGSLMEPSVTRWLSGIGIGQVEYIHLKGLMVRQIHQNLPNMSHAKPYSEVFGIGSGGANHYFENLVVHDVDGRAYQHWSDAWSEQDALYAVEAGYQDEPLIPMFASDNTTWINCDAYNLFDRYDDTPGNAADGWKVETYYGSTFTWKGCRAWNYSDDGFDPHGSGTRIFDTCWAMATDKYENLSSAWDVETNGFKTTGSTGVPLSNDDHGVLFKNCIATFNPGSGFITNLGSRGQFDSNPLYYNNLAYMDGWGYNGPNSSFMFNNIVYGTMNIGPTSEIYHIVAYRQWYDESHNTWIYHDPSPGSWPWNFENPAFNVTDEDFISLDYWELTRPRKADGSLPDVEFGHLSPDSELIDAGILIPDYHCDTAGAYPDGDCVEWYGEAPDLGPFEYKE